ncbi:MAG: TetR/AcrR family transcriptional regulator [Acidobacteriota bacterium]|nr:TetR/AcrR family transcriptional regulator [Acidobacteriota bacterium]MDQ7086328.1 TetR/AcrR family transcriptional regulator [Acidobacteriota bacterium]
MGDQRRAEILDQAMALLIEDGIAALTMKRVAERMGFTEPAMYRHFRNKQDLVIHLVRRTRDRFSSFYEGCDPADPPEVFLRQFLFSLLAFLDQVDGVTILFLSDSAYNRDDKIRAEMEALLGEQLGRLRAYLTLARERGEVREDLHPDAAALVLMGAVQALTIRHILVQQRPPIASQGEAVLDVLLRGVLS